MGIDKIWEESKVRSSKQSLLIISVDVIINKLNFPYLEEECMLGSLRKLCPQVMQRNSEPARDTGFVMQTLRTACDLGQTIKLLSLGFLICKMGLHAFWQPSEGCFPFEKRSTDVS